MGNEPCADNYGPVNVMELRERIFQETEREKAQGYLWDEIVLLQSQTFRTVKGLEYTYQIRGNEMFVSRKTKSITKASVNLALEKIIELSGEVAGELANRILELENKVGSGLTADNILMPDGSSVKTSILSLQEELGTNKTTLQNNINSIREVL